MRSTILMLGFAMNLLLCLCTLILVHACCRIQGANVKRAKKFISQSIAGASDSCPRKSIFSLDWWRYSWQSHYF